MVGTRKSCLSTASMLIECLLRHTRKSCATGTRKPLRDKHTVQSTLPDFLTRARFAGLRRLLSRNGILVQRELDWRTHTEKLCTASRRPELAIGLRLRGSVEAYVAFSALCQASHVFKPAAPPPLSNLVAKSSTLLIEHALTWPSIAMGMLGACIRSIYIPVYGTSGMKWLYGEVKSRNI